MLHGLCTPPSIPFCFGLSTDRWANTHRSWLESFRYLSFSSISDNSKRSTICCLNPRRPGCATDTHHAGNALVFPRINIQDPYERLGVRRDASKEEIWGSRKILLNRYARHERSAESIEVAFNKVMKASYENKKKTKPSHFDYGFRILGLGSRFTSNLKSILKRKVKESTPWVKNLLKSVTSFLLLFEVIPGLSLPCEEAGQMGQGMRHEAIFFAYIIFIAYNKKLEVQLIATQVLFVALICDSIFGLVMPSKLHPLWTPGLIMLLGTFLVACLFV